MRRASGAVAIGLGWFVCASIGAVAGPSIHVEHPIHDFGTVIEGTTVEHAFSIENRGDEDLVIEDVRASCGCTATELSTTRLIPRRIVRLAVSLSTGGLGGAEISKRVYVRTNDPEHPEVVLTVTGSVVPQAAYLIEARELVGSLRLLIDLRHPARYAGGHLLGAIGIPAEGIDAWFQYLPKQFPIVLYDQSGGQAGDAAERMLEAGFLDVQVLTGGFEEWVRLHGDRMVTTLETVFLPVFE